jgi:hypothetical protein
MNAPLPANPRDVRIEIADKATGKVTEYRYVALEDYERLRADIERLTREREEARGNSRAWEDTANHHKSEADAFAARLAQAERLLRRMHTLPDTLVEDAEWREARKAWSDVETFLAGASMSGTDEEVLRRVACQHDLLADAPTVEVTESPAEWVGTCNVCGGVYKLPKRPEDMRA